MEIQDLEVEILDIFQMLGGKTVAIIDCCIEPLTGYYLLNKDGEVCWKISGVVFSNNDHSQAIRYLNRKNLLRSVVLDPIKPQIRLHKGECYDFKIPPIKI